MQRRPPYQLTSHFQIVKMGLILGKHYPLIHATKRRSLAPLRSASLRRLKRSPTIMSLLIDPTCTNPPAPSAPQTNTGNPGNQANHWGGLTPPPTDPPGHPDPQRRLSAHPGTSKPMHTWSIRKISFILSKKISF